MIQIIRPALIIFILMSIITGFAYPLVVTSLAKRIFPTQAAGSIVSRDGKEVGSSLIGQNFSDPKYFWGRPSATGPMPYNATASGASNQGPLNPALTEVIAGRIAALRAADPGNTAAVPVDLVTASASGLDPHISPAAAIFQAARVSKVRAVPLQNILAAITKHTEQPLWGLIGEARVHVLQLNLELDAIP